MSHVRRVLVRAAALGVALPAALGIALGRTRRAQAAQVVHQ